MEAWQALRFVHIVSVIVALGANLTYLFWMGRARSEPAQLVFVIESIRRLDRRVSNPAYIVAAAAAWTSSPAWSFCRIGPAAR